MSNALQFLQSTRQQLRDWSWFKRSLLGFTILTFMVSSFMFLTPVGTEMRIWMANTVIITQHRDWAWIFVGTEQRDSMLQKMRQFIEENAEEKQQFNMVTVQPTSAVTRKNRTIDELIKVEDVSGTFWKGKRMYVYDPKSIRLMTPAKPGEGEKISSMVKRTGAVAGVNAGGFDDPEGLGNGFAAIGAVISGGEVIYTDQDSSVAQHIVGFTKEGTLVVGKYNMFELQEMGISEAASFYPRVIANGKPLPINDISRAPRTGVGQKADGTVIFIVADGRSTQSVGATLKEIQELFLADDVVNAGFLDGGASSELVVNGELVTKPSSRYGERRLPSAFLVYDHPEDAVANRVWDGLSSINAGGAFDHPDFLREQAELKAKAKNNPAPVTTPTPTKTTDTEQTKTPAANTGTNKPSGTNESTKPNTQSDATKPPQGTDNSKTTPPATNHGTKDTGKDTTTHPNTQQGGNGSPVTTDPVKPGETTPTGAGASGGTTNPTTNNPSSTTGGSNQQGQGTGSTSVPNTTPPAGSDASKNAPATNDASKNTPASSSDASTKNTPATGDATTKPNTPVTTPPASPAAPSGGSTTGGSTETTTVPVK
ncbi:phosphodiester glycosidase family protein [Paenibacillus sp. WQ 127069]|uniref:Phosphodiester glycosidase family protein n=1 Tax=Paenibacillus baimaensis TaxID=2982185 RepID=A0ABT2UFM6_9BACL|nr:phosphodiester glycosidase family protein [Paenibacillus sp. WQ 127069]MCU6793438.1 phosphodiester glycosidase family protein [Paenibacillus sp. WQ 127069]